MSGTCTRCGRRKAQRDCPALGIRICARCCGEDRLVRIDCPPTCVHLKAHEPFQVERQGARYRDAWRDAVRNAAEADLRALMVLERCLAEAARDEQVSDQDLARALEELDGVLSPIEIVTGAPTDATRELLRWVEEAFSAEVVTREALRDAIPHARAILRALERPNAPRAFVRGLLAWVGPATPEESSSSGLIVTPEDLHRFE
jgi:hypothetical protein